METSKTCGACGHRHAKLGGARVHKCPHCGNQTPRDANGARNIMLRALTDSSFTVSNDGIAIVTVRALSINVQECLALFESETRYDRSSELAAKPRDLLS